MGPGLRVGPDGRRFLQGGFDDGFILGFNDLPQGGNGGVLGGARNQCVLASHPDFSIATFV